MREQLPGERIVEVDGRPVRLVMRLHSGICATMVKPGYFPVSETGYRSILFGFGGVRSTLNDEEGTVDEVFADAEAGLEGLPDEKREGRQSVIQRCESEAPDRERAQNRPIGTIVTYMSPSARKLANTLLTSRPHTQSDVIEAGIRQYEHTIRLPEPNWTIIEDHRAWTKTGYQYRKQKAAETLRMLREARSGGLFCGAENLEPALQVASPSVRKAYGWVPDNPTHEADIRADLRAERDTTALTGPDLDLLADDLVAAGYEPRREDGKAA